ncbi:hypothetical protein FA95DRAFT_1604825 [Auriscalpium vulgare]|uniref:Uncharacterized protein n=1 Tax=Auriscalpium vulgare TaxID=40419 RepID=A0ACB8RXR0_9AGAM|nr:hypothetical protein FA95DRAFT_1604825 [Auriscalpium vulgare]
MSSETGTSPPVNSNKRRRTEEPDVEDIESPELWFNDGNIIIRSIPDTRTTPPRRMLYKLHKFVLAMHCAVFASLFDGPQDAFAAGSEHRDGLPVMDLSDDLEELPAADISTYRETHLHRDSSAVPFDERWDAFPSSYYGILRLAYKYDAVNIRNIVLPEFVAMWPTELAKWDQLQLRDAEPQQAYDKYEFIHPKFSITLAIGLAVECNIPDVLPLAYYNLACHLAATNTDYLAKIVSNMAPDDVRKVLVGLLTFKEHLAPFNGMTNSHNDCSNLSQGQSQCTHTIKRCYAAMLEKGWHITEPLGWYRWVLSRVNALKLCAGCKIATTQWITNEREKLWRALPEVFGLKGIASPGWGAPAASIPAEAGVVPEPAV